MLIIGCFIVKGSHWDMLMDNMNISMHVYFFSCGIYVLCALCPRISDCMKGRVDSGWQESFQPWVWNLELKKVWMLASISSLPPQPTIVLFLSHPLLFILEFKESVSLLHFTASRVKLTKSNRGEQKEDLNLMAFVENKVCVCVCVHACLGQHWWRGSPTVSTTKLKYGAWRFTVEAHTTTSITEAPSSGAKNCRQMRKPKRNQNASMCSLMKNS